MEGNGCGEIEAFCIRRVPLLVRQQDPLDSTPDRLGNLLRMETLRAVEVTVVHTMKACSPVLQ